VSTPGKALARRRPNDGVSAPAITLYTASFDLKTPRGYDLPLAMQLDRNSSYSTSARALRALHLVNGYQFGSL
jgi:hypothetical protein